MLPFDDLNLFPLLDPVRAVVTQAGIGNVDTVFVARTSGQAEWQTKLSQFGTQERTVGRNQPADSIDGQAGPTCVYSSSPERSTRN